MKTLALIHCAPDDVASEVMQRDSSMKTLMHGNSFKSAKTNIDTTDEVDQSAAEQLRTPPSEATYAMSVKCDDGSYDARRCVILLRGDLSRSNISLNFLKGYAYRGKPGQNWRRADLSE